MTKHDLIGAVEAAQILGYSARTVKRMANSGHLPFAAKMPGTTGAFVFDRTVIEQHAANRTRIADLILNGTAPTVVITDESFAEALTATSKKRAAA